MEADLPRATFTNPKRQGARSARPVDTRNTLLESSVTIVYTHLVHTLQSFLFPFTGDLILYFFNLTTNPSTPPFPSTTLWHYSPE